jgi:ankyrin repeat protein
VGNAVRTTERAMRVIAWGVRDVGKSIDVLEAIRVGNAGRLEALLVQDGSLAASRDESGVSAILHARYRSRMDMVDLLLACRPQLDVLEAAALGQTQVVAMHLDAERTAVSTFSGDGFTALHLAAFFAQPEVVALLLRRGADPNAVARNASRVSPLHSAVAGRNLDTVRLLLMQGADPNARQQGGWTALHAAALHGDMAVARLLLTRGASPQAANDDGTTALQIASEKGHAAMVELMQFGPAPPPEE